VEVRDLAGRLRAWADDQLLPGAAIAGLAPMPGNAGLSFGFDVLDATGAVRRSLVIRLAPPGVRRAGNTDVLRQVPLLEALRRSRVPIAPLVWWTGDPAWFGTDGIVQERLPARSIGLFRADPLAPPEDLSRQLRAAVEALAAVHAVDWQRELAEWQDPRSIPDEVAAWDRLLDRFPNAGEAEAGRRLGAELLASDPGGHRVGLVHGDYHVNNVLFDDRAAVAAVIDWEIAGIGATGLDLGYLSVMSDPSCWHPSRGVLLRAVAAPAQLQEWYEAAAGIPVPHASWYQALACHRFGAIAGFNLRLHRTGRREDPLYEELASSVPALFRRGMELLGAAS
jgi:aminoglycoside phosphotransferase (APT) family kinase protein